MNRVWLGALLGVTVGVADVLLMLPLQFQDRTAAAGCESQSLRFLCYKSSTENAAPCRYAAIVMSRWSLTERSDLRDRLCGERAKAGAEWSSRLFTGSRWTRPFAARSDW